MNRDQHQPSIRKRKNEEEFLASFFPWLLAHACLRGRGGGVNTTRARPQRHAEAEAASVYLSMRVCLFCSYTVVATTPRISLPPPPPPQGMLAGECTVVVLLAALY